MNTNFTEVMTQKTEDELIEITTVLRDEYQPLAVKAAEVELRKRKVQTSQIQEVTEKIIRKKEEQVSFQSAKVSSLNRFLHFVIDTTAIMFITLVLETIVAYAIPPTVAIPWSRVAVLILFSVFFLYYTLWESIAQKTLGKVLTRSIVVMENGAKPTSTEIVIRTLCRLIPLDGLTYLYSKDGFHDRLSHSSVVKDSFNQDWTH